jgi:peptide/nickel transport system substrate-binding protein
MGMSGRRGTGAFSRIDAARKESANRTRIGYFLRISSECPIAARTSRAEARCWGSTLAEPMRKLIGLRKDGVIMGRRVVALFAYALALCLLADAGVASASNTHRVSSTSGGTVVVAVGAQENVDWYLPMDNAANETGINHTFARLLYQPLVWITENYQVDYSSSIASRITYNASGTVYNVYLNPKWHWSNGTPITSADALFSFDVQDAASEPNAPSPWAGTGSGEALALPLNLKSIKVDGPYELTITLKHPANQAWFVQSNLDVMVIMPAVWNKYPTDMAKELAYLAKETANPTFDTPVSGPFELTAAQPNESWTFVPNPNYSGHKASISRLVLEDPTSDAAEFAALKTGEIQVGYLPADDWAVRSELPDRIIPEQGFGFTPVFLNMTSTAEDGVNRIFDQLYVRQALQMGIDETAIDQGLYKGQYELAYGPVPDSPTAAGSFLAPALEKPIYPYDPAAGLKLMERHGWHLVDGVLTKGSQTMRFTMIYLSGSLTTTESMELMQADWAKEGIKVTLESSPLTSLVGTLGSRPKDWELVGGVSLSWGMGQYPSGDGTFDGGIAGWIGWNNAEENRLINATLAPSATSAQSQANFFKYEVYTAKELPMLWTGFALGEKAVATDLRGVTANTIEPALDIQPQYWSIAPAK